MLSAREWVSTDSVFIKGHINFNGKYYAHTSLLDLAKIISRSQDIDTLIQKFIGNFCIIIKREKKVLLVSDNIRSMPLFYKLLDGHLTVTDHLSYITSSEQPTRDNEATSDFLTFGFVLNDKTLLKNYCQLEAAEIVEFSNAGLKKKEYWSYHSENSITKLCFESQKLQLADLFLNVSSRLAQSVKNLHVVVPLSGGYDSRLIICLLKEAGIKDVTCFTYGAPGSFEVNRAERVANELCYQIIKIPYDHKFFDRYFNLSELKDYIKFASNFTSLAHIQDFLAVKHLHQRQLIPENSVFVPGHSGDIFAGTHIPSNLGIGNDLLRWQKEVSKKQMFSCSMLPQKLNYYNPKFSDYSNAEGWSWKERQSKFIVNSVRAYEYFGYGFRTPLWDQELANYFRGIGLKQKNRNSPNYNIPGNMYDCVIFDIFNKYKVAYEKQDDYTYRVKIKNKIKSLVTGRRDVINNMDYFIKKINGQSYMLSKDINYELAKININILFDR